MWSRRQALDPRACSLLSSCDVVAVTVQVPSNLHLYCECETPFPPGCVDPCFAAPSHLNLTVSEDGKLGQSFRFVAVSSSIHILNSCDSVTAPFRAALPSGCQPQVYRRDGTLLTTSNPARGGEIITLYAVRLGKTSPLVPEGIASPASTVPIGRLAVQVGIMLYAGLVPGFAGLYQVNVRLPDSLPDGVKSRGPDAPNFNLTRAVR